MSMQAIPELDFVDTERALKWLFRAQITGHIVSRPGQGKTSLIDQLTASYGPRHGLFELNGALANQPDFMGWFYRNKEVWTDYDGSERTIEAGRYTYPYWWFDKRTKLPIFQYETGTLVIEEFDKIELDLKRALGQLFLEGRAGSELLPGGKRHFNIVSLANYATDRSGGTKDLDMLVNRRGQLHMRNSADNWLANYAHPKGMENVVMAFASIETHGVFSGDLPKEQGPWLNPRSTDMLDALVKVLVKDKESFDDPVVVAAITGLIGAGSSGQFCAFAKLRDQIPTIDEIVANPAGCRVPTASDQAMFTIFNMAEKAERKNIAALVTYMGRLPSDMAVAFYKNALTRDPKLMQCREFGDWAIENKTLIGVVNSKSR